MFVASLEVSNANEHALSCSSDIDEDTILKASKTHHHGDLLMGLIRSATDFAQPHSWRYSSFKFRKQERKQTILQPYDQGELGWSKLQNDPQLGQRRTIKQTFLLS